MTTKPNNENDPPDLDEDLDEEQEQEQEQHSDNIGNSGGSVTSEGQFIVGKMSAISAALHRQAQAGIKGVDDFDEGSITDTFDVPENLPRIWTIDGHERECVVVRMQPERWLTHPLYRNLLPVTKAQFCPPMNPGQFDGEGFLRSGDIITFLCPKSVWMKFKNATRRDVRLRNEQMSRPTGDPNKGGLVMQGAKHELVEN